MATGDSVEICPMCMIDRNSNCYDSKEACIYYRDIYVVQHLPAQNRIGIQQGWISTSN